MKRGYELTRNPHLNKGMAFTLEERQQLNIHGLLPPCFLSQEVQVLRILMNFERQTSDLDRYILLMGLQDRNEKLFYKVLTSNIERFMPIVYTPTVGLACQQLWFSFSEARGLFITIHDRGHIATMLKSWPEDVIRAIVVTDGERILGLGDLGCYGMGIPVGKLALYTACGGMKPQACLPVILDVGTDNEELLKDPLYIGLRHKRVRGQAYDDLLDEFMQAVTSRYGMNCLIQFEDFANANAFRLLNKYRNKYCTFNDDIQGTAAVAVAGLLAALRITENKLSDHTILFQGAGEAAMGIANLIIMAMQKEGTPEDEAIRKIWMVDSKGLIVKDRSSLTSEKERFAHKHDEMKNLEDIVRDIKPSVLIGVAAIGGAFTKQILKAMASFNKRPIIFALSNPTSKAECSAEQCYQMTEGRGIFASGSPFDPVTLPSGCTFYPGQGNNAYVFPGVALGVVLCGLRYIREDIFLTTAEMSDMKVIPSFNIFNCETWVYDDCSNVIKGTLDRAGTKGLPSKLHTILKEKEVDKKTTPDVKGIWTSPKLLHVVKQLPHFFLEGASFWFGVIAQQVSKKHLEEGRLYPPLVTIRDVSLKIAVKIVEQAYSNKTASFYPEPEDKEEFVRSQIYSTDYDSFVVDSYVWPDTAMKVQTGNLS